MAPIPRKKSRKGARSRRADPANNTDVRKVAVFHELPKRREKKGRARRGPPVIAPPKKGDNRRWIKGQSGNPAGRKRGTKNKIPQRIKQQYAEVFEKIGGVEEFATWARNNREQFYKLHARLIPHEVTGQDGGALVPTEIRMVLVDPAAKKVDKK